MVESGSMHIVCPYCTTSYAINPASLGAAGRNVRCARCKEVWLARPEDAFEPAPQPVMAEGETDPYAGGTWNNAPGEDGDGEAPHVESPPIADDRQGSADDWIALVRDAGDDAESEPRPRWWQNMFRRRQPGARRTAAPALFPALPTSCAAMGALVVALLVWRADVVRLLPQTANFYRLVGLDVNLRGLAFKDVKVSTETVEGKPVLVIEGMIVGKTRKTVELPRLRFSVRDAQGTEIYAWNAVLEQTTLKPGDHAWFKSRLASPPTEGKSIDIRFFNKHDIAGGSV
jgi:predicted Zn finger-like uncharacterized protein